MWRLNNIPLSNRQITEGIKEEINILRDKRKLKHDNPKPMGHSKSSSKREVQSNTILPQEKRKISSKPLKLTLKATRERRTNKTQIQQKERNHKNQSRDK